MSQSAGGKLTIITGASSGIGRAVAQRFVERGTQVINLARRPSGVLGVRDIEVDLSDIVAAERAALLLLEALRAAESACIVHNASDLPQDAADHFEVEAMQRTLRLNAVVPALLNRLWLPQLEPGSCIVFIGSTLSEKGVPAHLSYVTAKHAVVGLMRATCQDLQGRGIHTACICPGFTDTEMLRPALAGEAQARRSMLDKVGYGRLIAPDEIAALVAFVADQSVLNGAVLHANLGQRES